jgi:hypothetical protein
MKKYYYIISFIFPFFITDNCDKINGKYFSVVDIRMNSNLNDNFEIIIGDSTYVKCYSNGKVVRGKILKSENSKKFILEDSNQIIEKESVVSNWGNEVLEILECKNDTLKFKTRPKNNLHLTRLTGKLIKKK